MATAQPLPASAAAARHPETASVNKGSQELALVPSDSQSGTDEPEQSKGPMTMLPVELDVTVPVRKFRVRNLLALEPGRLIESQWVHGMDVPLAAGHVLLAWTEFEVIDSLLAVRVTRLA